jgi:hypothetical protein
VRGELAATVVSREGSEALLLTRDRLEVGVKGEGAGVREVWVSREGSELLLLTCDRVEVGGVHVPCCRASSVSQAVFSLPRLLGCPHAV